MVKKTVNKKIILGYAEELKRYCHGRSGNCGDCIFKKGAYCSVDGTPEGWETDNVVTMTKAEAVSWLEGMRSNALRATHYNDENRDFKAEALRIAIAALKKEADA